MNEDNNLDGICVNTIRMLAVDAVENAGSGHPGLPLGAAPMAYVLWDRFLRHNPGNPSWPDRDRFVLSAGHGSMLLYSLLYLTGYALPLEEIKRFRRWGSITPGHPEHGLTPGVETTTGPLGQGFANAVGMALAESFLSRRFNKEGLEIIGHHTYALISDGDLMEGVSHEAASLAGHLKLGKLVCLYDDNGITIEGKTEITFSEDVELRFRAYGWNVLRVSDGNNLEEIEKALSSAKSRTEKPSIIIVKTHIGYGSPGQDTPGVHGEPLGPEAVRATKKKLGWPEDEFFRIPAEALGRFRKAVASGRGLEESWTERFREYKKRFPSDAAVFERVVSGKLPEGWDGGIPVFTGGSGPVSTREASGKVMNAVADFLENLIGGSADLAPSVRTLLVKYPGRNVHFGVREHAMGGIVNGMALHGGLIPYGSTFLVFSDYMRPALRLASLMQAPSIFIFSHDSAGLGEDGPTHQPVEHLMALRAIPGMTVIRPADANETACAWKAAIERRRPVALILTRQKLPVLVAGGAIKGGFSRGAYVLRDGGSRPDIIIIATGSEVHVALAAGEKLKAGGVNARVVSMPSWEIFGEQPEQYRDEVLPPDVSARLSIEAGITLGWRRWVGEKGISIGIDRFGASAPGAEVMEKLGISADNTVSKALSLLRR